LAYPWYDKVGGNDIQQGDILENCPGFILPSEIQISPSSITSEPWEVRFEFRDVIVMSQACDMIKGQEKISEVLLCGIWMKSDFTEGFMSKKEHWNMARKGQVPGFHVLRAYPNNPLYCGRLQSPRPAWSAKNVLDVEKTTPPSIFGLPPWPRTFRSAS